MRGDERKGWIFQAPLILVAAMIAAIANAAGPAEGPVMMTPAAVPVIDVRGAPGLGPENAQVTIVEFSDFQCPYSAGASRTLYRLLELYPTQVRWVFKHYPLRGHRDAPLAHEASLAAHQQGKFWEMRNLLFGNQTRLKREDILRHASELDLDMPAFTEELDTRRLRDRVVRDILQGRRLQVGMTPTYFINGKKIAGARRLSEFRKLIDRELDGGTPSPRPWVEQTWVPDR
jgi:protein-disulfide isomerase